MLGYFANPASMYLGGYSATEAAAGVAKQINGYNGLKNAITAIDPDATVDYMKGFTGTGTTAAALTAVDPAAVAAAANYDAVIVYTGTDGGTANEDTDRTAVTLPGAQGSLITQVEAANPNTIVYMETIGPVDVRPFEPTTSTLLWSSYNGMRKGDALADVVLGNYDPSRPHRRRSGSRTSATCRRRRTTRSARPRPAARAAPTSTSRAPCRTRSATA